MKKIILALALIVASSSFITTEAQHVSVNINIGSQPAWGPVGYDYVDYYYIPEINVYYNVPQSMFYYWNRGNWVAASYLPYSYRHYDLYHMYKVVLHDRDPWHHNRTHIKHYGHYKGHRNQKVIYYSNDHRYRHSKNNRTVWYNDGHKSNHRYNNNNNKSNHRYDNNRSARVDNNKNKNYDRNRNNNVRSNNRNSQAAQGHKNNLNNNRSNNNREKVSSTRSSGTRQFFTQTSNDRGATKQRTSERTTSRSSGRR